MKNGKKLNFNKLFNLIGSVLLAAMLVIVSFNFIRDARILRKPALSTTKSNAAKEKGNTGSGNYKTLKYKKPAVAAKKNNKAAEKKSTTTTAAVKPEKTVSVPAGNP